MTGTAEAHWALGCHTHTRWLPHTHYTKIDNPCLTCDHLLSPDNSVNIGPIDLKPTGMILEGPIT